MTSLLILRQIGILATVVLIGLLACRAKVITAGTKDFLAKLIFYVTLPSMLLTSFSAIEVTPRLLANSRRSGKPGQQQKDKDDKERSHGSIMHQVPEPRVKQARLTLRRRAPRENR